MGRSATLWATWVSSSRSRTPGPGFGRWRVQPVQVAAVQDQADAVPGGQVAVGQGGGSDGEVQDAAVGVAGLCVGVQEQHHVGVAVGVALVDQQLAAAGAGGPVDVTELGRWGRTDAARRTRHPAPVWRASWSPTSRWVWDGRARARRGWRRAGGPRPAGRSGRGRAAGPGRAGSRPSGRSAASWSQVHGVQQARQGDHRRRDPLAACRPGAAAVLLMSVFRGSSGSLGRG